MLVTSWQEAEEADLSAVQQGDRAQGNRPCDREGPLPSASAPSGHQERKRHQREQEPSRVAQEEKRGGAEEGAPPKDCCAQQNGQRTPRG